MINPFKQVVQPKGFTIVELLIVIVVIGILAAITVVAYTGISQQASATALKSDLTQAKTQLDLAKINSGNDTYPASPSGTNPPTSLKPSPSTTYQYTVDNNSSPATYCLSATNNTTGQAFHLDSTTGTPEDGVCDGHTAPSGGGGGAIVDGDLIQTITSSNCPTTRTMTVDARDNHTYWVQKLADGKCWMLTNLAYAGGGINTYGDVKTLTNGTGDSFTTYTEPKYYVHASANPTTNPTEPSTSTDGGATNPQYGYHYNWCAAMGVQTTTSACSNATTPAPNTTISICPAGWRLPTGEPTTGEFTLINNAVNGGLTNTDAGLRANWLAQRGGYWSIGFSGQGDYGLYWSTTRNSASSILSLFFYSIGVRPAYDYFVVRGLSVRCVAT